MSEKRGSNPRPQPWEGCALPTELLSQNVCCALVSHNCGAKVSIFFEFTKHPDEKNNKLRFGFNSFVVKVLILTKKMYFCNP